MHPEHETIGRAKTALVFGQGDNQKAVISAVLASASASAGDRRLSFVGAVDFSGQVKEHIKEVILPIIDRIACELGIPQKHFEISAVNLGAASAKNIGINISGFSADTPVFLSMLSSLLDIPVPDDIISTGHIASVKGDIAAVRALWAKTEVACADNSIRCFIYPDLDKDISQKILSPHERDECIKAIMSARDKIKTHPVRDIAELVRTVFNEELIVFSSLKKGFFNISTPSQTADGPIGTAVCFLTNNNIQRFWDAAEQYLLKGDCVKAKEFFQAYADYYIEQKQYPSGFGIKLHSLLCSLPPSVRRLQIKSFLVDTGRCIRLSQSAVESDHEDVRMLFKSLYDRHLAFEDNKGEKTMIQNPDSDCTAFDMAVAQISETTLARSFGIPIDSARACYVMSSSTVDSYEQFLDTLTAFCIHMWRHINQDFLQSVNMERAETEAIALLEKAFLKNGGIQGAFVRAKDGTNGGMRSVLDAVTEHMKNKAQSKHIVKIFREALEPLNWDERVSFMRGALKRLSPFMSPELRKEPPERFARHYEEVAEIYVRSIDKVNELLKKL